MAIDIYSSAVLNRVVQDLKTQANTFLLDTFFPQVSVSPQEEIFFDVANGKARLAPFVSPLVEGHLVENLGYSTASFKPAYVKDKRLIEDGRAIRRQAGDPIGGPIDLNANRQAQLAQMSLDQIQMLNRRLEWMAAEVLRTGAVTVAGEKYPTSVVNFGRDPSLTVALTGAGLWNASTTVDIAGNLESWADLVRAASGASAVDVVMAQNAYTAFRKNDGIKDLALKSALLSERTELDLGPDSMRYGAAFKGTIGAFRIWVYADTYVDATGTTQKYVPDGYVLLISREQLEGVRHFGAIKDETAGFQAVDYFSKSWTNPDPAGRYLMLQSAPLVVPYRVNASLSAKVI